MLVDDELSFEPVPGVLAAAVQQRLTTASRLQGWIDQLRPLRRAKLFRRALADIDQGAHSASELEITRLCRAFGFPRPARQVARRDSRGNQRWTDCEWRLPDGTVLVLEVDGSHHLDVQSWTAIRRTRRISGQGRIVVRCTAYELRHEAQVVAEDLMNLGLIGRVPETGLGPVLRHTTG